MKHLFLLTTLLLSLGLSAQDNFLFDTSKVDANTMLIGRYPQYDKEKTYQHLNFCVNDPIEIKKVLQELTIDKEVENQLEQHSFRISIVQNNREINGWIISLNLGTILYNGHSYKFDIKKVKKLNSRYPFDYRFESVVFKTIEEYETYLEKQKLDTTFLFDYGPVFRYEGSFEIEFPRNDQFSSPKAITEYLKPKVDAIVNKDSVLIGYRLSPKNAGNLKQFTMTIQGSKKLFETLQLDNLKKENWTTTVEEGMFFYRTK